MEWEYKMDACTNEFTLDIPRFLFRMENEDYFDLEQRHLSLRKEHELVCEERDSFKCNYASLNFFLLIIKFIVFLLTLVVNSANLQSRLNEVCQKVLDLENNCAEYSFNSKQVCFIQ
jgi:hypothetical protein